MEKDQEHPLPLRTTNTTSRSFFADLGFGGESALAVGDLDAESLGLGDDIDTLGGGDSVTDPGKG